MFVITAASGQLGRLVVQELAKQVPTGQIAVSVRDPQKVQDFANQGITVRQADYDHVDELAAAFTGAEKVVFISGNAPLAVRNPQHMNVIAAAESAQVKQVIYTSFLDADPASPFTFSAGHVATERALQASRLDWVITRPSVYADMVIPTAQQAIQSGQLVTAAPNGRVSYITRHDIARALVAILVGEGHSQQTYDLTGPATTSQNELAATLSVIGERPVAVQAIDFDTYAASLRNMGLPEEFVTAYTGLQKAFEENRFAVVSPDVEQLTGQAPESLDALLKRTLPALLEASS